MPLFKQNENLPIIKRILSLLKAYKTKIFAIVFLMTVSAGIEMLLPLLGKLIIDEGLLLKDMSYIFKISIFAIVLVILNGAVKIWETKHQSYISSMLPFDLLKRSFKHLLSLKLEYFNKKNATEIMKNIDMDVSNVARVADREMFFVATEVLNIISGIAGLILFIDWKMTLFILLFIPIRYLIVKHLANERTNRFDKYMGYAEDYASWYGDSIGGIKEIKLWALERKKIGQFVKKQRNLIKTNIQLSFIDKINFVSETVLFEVLTYALYIFGGFLIAQDSLTVGGLFAFITYSTYITAPISSIIGLGYDFSTLLPSAKRLFGFLDNNGEHEEKICPARIDPLHAEGSIKFENISFSYEADTVVLNNINFEIRSGEKVAIIGSNGSGKTSILKLLLRFYSPDSGRILINNKDIREYNIKDYRRLISVVSQDFYLFNNTIQENISLFSKVNEGELFKAIKNNQVYKFIDSFPEKYNTLVGRDGMNLSGGQRQKIALARALARKFKILVLDEVTSNLDIESESFLNDLLAKNLTDKTVLLITHRQSVLKKVDKIIMLNDGNISAVGTYEQLFTDFIS